MVPNQIDSPTNRTFLSKVSVVIPIYNGEVDLPDLISCLRAQTYPVARVEYLLVDNASCDRTAAILQAAAQDAKSQGLTIYYLTENQIQSSYAARNAGIRASTGEIIAFTDADCRPQPNWLYALIQPFADPAVGLVGGAIVALPGKTLLEKYAERKNILSHKFGLSHPFCPYGATANLAIRRQTLEQVGLFRPYLTTGGDVDICWRIQMQSSWQFYCAEQAIVQHRHRATLQELLNQRRRYGRSHQYVQELYGVDVSENIFKLKQYLYYFSRWLLKELPLTGVKAIAGKATLLDLLMTPIFLLTRQAQAAGQREAKLSEQARQIEWLEQSQLLNPDSIVTAIGFQGSWARSSTSPLKRAKQMYSPSPIESQRRQVERKTDWDKSNRDIGNLKTIFAPQFLGINPYQKQLAEHLVELGIQVEGVDSRKIFLPTAVTQWSPDILHLHWLHTFFQAPSAIKSLFRLVKFISGLVILRLMGVKIVWTAHNLKNHENLYPLLEQICTSVTARLAHAIIAHCEAAKCEIATTLHLRNKDKIFVLPHGNYTRYYENKIDRVEARKALDIPNSSLVFLFLGLIRPYKGVFELIEAFKQLHSDEVQLVIAGKPWNDEIAEQTRQKTEGHDNIKFMAGFVSEDQIQVYMNACDVVVFPYQDVLTSGAVILAMSFGRPCIAPRMGCIGEILDNLGAFLYDPNLEEGLFQALNLAMENSANLLRMGEYNQQSAEQWSWDRVAEMTLNVYRKCLSD